MHKANPINVKENLIITHFKPQFKEKSVSDMHRVVEQTGHRDKTAVHHIQRAEPGIRGERARIEG